MFETVHESDTKQCSLPLEVAADSVARAYGHARRNIDETGCISQMTCTKSACERLHYVVGVCQSTVFRSILRAVIKWCRYKSGAP